MKRPLRGVPKLPIARMGGGGSDSKFRTQKLQILNTDRHGMDRKCQFNTV